MMCAAARCRSPGPRALALAKDRAMRPCPSRPVGLVGVGRRGAIGLAGGLPSQPLRRRPVPSVDKQRPGGVEYGSARQSGPSFCHHTYESTDPVSEVVLSFRIRVATTTSEYRACSSRRVT